MLMIHYMRALIGMLLWKRISTNYQADLYILMPEEGQEYNYYALLHMKQYIKEKKADRVIILSHDKGVMKSLPLFIDDERVKAVKLSRSKALYLIKYYALYEFSTKFTIISLTEPYDTCGENLLGVKGVNKEDLLCFDIYHFSEVPKSEAPIYKGKDEDILNFLNTSCR